MASPSSASVAPPALRGHAEPRLFTPELRPLTPATSWGFECCEFLEQVLGWELIPWQRWLYIHALERDEAGTGFRFDTICVLIARQNGKTKWLIGLGLWRLFVDGAHLAVITAQNLDYAEGTLAEADAEIDAHADLRSEKVRFSQTNGKHRLILTNRRQWRAAAANRRGGRSLSADLAELDELREHQSWEAWNAIVPTTTAVPRSQVVCASNAGDATSVVLRTVRDNAIARIELGQTADTRTGLFEYSAPREADDYQDPRWWPYANPSLGYRVTVEKLRGYAESMTEAGFRTEHMCQWVDSIETGIIPTDDWQATLDANSRRAEGAPVFAAVDVNYQRSKAYIAIAARRDDGRLHVEVVAAQAGVDWVRGWLVERIDRFEAVAIQARGAPASSLIDTLLEAGVPVVEWGGPDLSKGCGHFFDLVVTHGVTHRPQPPLDSAAKTARARPIGDAWVLDRKNSPNDVAPLVACAAAAWAEDRPVEQPFRSAYEDIDDDEPMLL